MNPPWCDEGSFIEHIDIGEIMWLNEHNGLYVLNTKVAPVSRQTKARPNAGFGRQANP